MNVRERERLLACRCKKTKKVHYSLAETLWPLTENNVYSTDQIELSVRCKILAVNLKP